MRDLNSLPTMSPSFSIAWVFVFVFIFYNKMELSPTLLLLLFLLKKGMGVGVRMAEVGGVVRETRKLESRVLRASANIKHSQVNAKTHM